MFFYVFYSKINVFIIYAFDHRMTPQKFRDDISNANGSGVIVLTDKHSATNRQTVTTENNITRAARRCIRWWYKLSPTFRAKLRPQVERMRPNINRQPIRHSVHVLVDRFI